MGNGHGGKKIRIVFGSNDKGEVVASVKNFEYPHSHFSKKFRNSGEWTLWEQEKPHRPAQAIEEFLVFCADMGWVDGVDLNAFWLKYWARDMNLTKEERLKGIKSFIK
jgi:hypothetical protein